MRSFAIACSQHVQRELTCLRAWSRRPSALPADGALDDLLVEGALEEAPMEGALDEPLPLPSFRCTNFLERRSVYETTAVIKKLKAIEQLCRTYLLMIT